MFKLGFFTISLVMLTACGDSEPVASSYKKSMAQSAPGAATTPVTPTPSGGADATALKAQGTTVYAAKCANCHGALATTPKRGATAARLTASATNPNHVAVTPFPSGTDITALEAALK